MAVNGEGTCGMMAARGLYDLATLLLRLATSISSWLSLHEHLRIIGIDTLFYRTSLKHLKRLACRTRVTTMHCSRLYFWYIRLTKLSHGSIWIWLKCNSWIGVPDVLKKHFIVLAGEVLLVVAGDVVPNDPVTVVVVQYRQAGFVVFAL